MNSITSDTYSTSKPLSALKAPSSTQPMWFLSSWLQSTQERQRGFVTQDTYTIFLSPRGVVVIIDTVSSTLMDYGKSILV